jgi:hypothetical protein
VFWFISFNSGEAFQNMQAITENGSIGVGNLAIKIQESEYSLDILRYG